MGNRPLADQSSFTSDIQEHLDSLNQAALRNTRHSQDAEDLVQETLLRAYRGYHTFDAGTNLRAWLHTILRNQYINVYRKKQRSVEEVDLGELDSMYRYKNTGPEAYKSVQSAEEQYVNSPFDERLDEGLAQLPEHFLEPIWLVDVLRMTYAEAAVKLEVPIGTIMSRLHRGRTALQEWLYDEHHMV